MPEKEEQKSTKKLQELAHRLPDDKIKIIKRGGKTIIDLSRLIKLKDGNKEKTIEGARKELPMEEEPKVLTARDVMEQEAGTTNLPAQFQFNGKMWGMDKTGKPARPLNLPEDKTKKIETAVTQKRKEQALDADAPKEGVSVVEKEEKRQVPDIVSLFEKEKQAVQEGSFAEVTPADDTVATAEVAENPQEAQPDVFTNIFSSAQDDNLEERSVDSVPTMEKSAPTPEDAMEKMNEVAHGTAATPAKETAEFYQVPVLDDVERRLEALRKVNPEQARIVEQALKQAQQTVENVNARNRDIAKENSYIETTKEQNKKLEEEEQQKKETEALLGMLTQAQSQASKELSSKDTILAGLKATSDEVGRTNERLAKRVNDLNVKLGMVSTGDTKVVSGRPTAEPKRNPLFDMVRDASTEPDFSNVLAGGKHK